MGATRPGIEAELSLLVVSAVRSALAAAASLAVSALGRDPSSMDPSSMARFPSERIAALRIGIHVSRREHIQCRRMVRATETAWERSSDRNRLIFFQWAPASICTSCQILAALSVCTRPRAEDTENRAPRAPRATPPCTGSSRGFQAPSIALKPQAVSSGCPAARGNVTDGFEWKGKF